MVKRAARFKEAADLPAEFVSLLLIFGGHER
jgi:hypothetical protein